MCGINLIIDKHKRIDAELIDSMSASTRHRGPDESKSRRIDTKSNTYFLAANRLKITDQSEAASQPFISPDSKYALLFNGEIYNFDSLKNELIDRQIHFSSHSDTEVLFYWLQLYGKSGIEKLKGMFAFIFIDFEKDEILVARDRFGIKPIYYYKDDNCIIFSSEIKSIVGTGMVKKEINDAQIHHYLLYKYAKKPETLYRHIFELQNGAVLEINNTDWQIKNYIQHDIKIKATTPDLTLIEEHITNSLLKQLDAQVPLGLLLSGGVDSTLLLAIARKQGFTLPTYTIVNSKSDRFFGTKDYHYSRMAASKYASEHTELEMDISMLDQFDHFIEGIDQPIGDSSLLMTSEICGNASTSSKEGHGGMKILLSGAGADELFAGYNRHFAFHKYLNHKRTLDVLAPYLKPIVNLLPSGFPHPLRKSFRHAKKWWKSMDSSPVNTYRNFLTFNELVADGHKSEFIDQFDDNTDMFGWALQHDQNNYLISDVLALTDKASMLHGIEMRVPYLDENLAHYLTGIPPSTLIKNGRKWILGDLLIQYGGRKFVNRPKEGFGLPLANWLFNKKIRHLWELFESKESIIFNYVEKNKFDFLVNQQKQKAEDHGPLLWSILVLGHWLQRNFS